MTTRLRFWWPLLLVVVAQPALAAPFGTGNLVVYQYDGGVTAGNAGSVSLLEFKPDGTPVQTLPVASLTASDTRSEGLLTRSADGKCLAVPGYSAAVGAANVAASSVARKVLLLGPGGDTTGNVTFGTSGASAFLGSSIRGGVSSDCTQVWASGNGSGATTRGVWYGPRNGATSTQVQLTNVNAQGIQIAAGQLYAAFASNGTLSRVGTGLPTGTPSATSPLPGMPANNIRGISLLKLGTGPSAVDTAYVANNDTGAIEKYSFDGTGWAARGSLPLAGAHGLVALDTGAGQVLLFASGSDGNIYRVFDRSGATGTWAPTPTSMASVAGTQTPAPRWFGMALTPEVSPPTAVPGAPTNITAASVTNGFQVQWQAPAAGAPVAWYVLEVSSDNFATVAREYFVPASAPSLSQAVTGLANGTYAARVRAVNSRGGSANLTYSGGMVVQPPTVSGLANHTAVSGVIGDATDPGATQGLRFQIAHPGESASQLTVKAESSDPTVVPAAGLSVTRSGGEVTLKIVPAGVGYSNITVTVTSSNGFATQRVVRYAASRAVSATPATRWYSGRSDGSTGILLNSGASLMVADDEAPAVDASGQPLPGGNALWAYRSAASGAPAATPAIDSALALSLDANCTAPGLSGVSNCKSDGEVDLEGSMRIGNRLYLTGSHSNNKSGNTRADRWRLFAADLINEATSPTLAVPGYYRWLREDMRAWDAANGSRFGLVASSAGGADNAPEKGTLDGFSIEGLSSSPDDGAAWFGFRAPLVPAPGQPAPTHNSAAGRTHALIVAVTNYDSLATAASGGTAGSARFGSPIWLDLGGRGVREITKNAAGEYLIIAGPPGGASGVAPGDFRLYSWDGSVAADGRASNLRLRTAPLLASLSPTVTGCSPEGFAELPASLAAGGAVGLVSDCGDALFYGDAVAAKDLPFNEWKKFRRDAVQLDALATATVVATIPDGNNLAASVSASQAGQFRWVLLPATAPAPNLQQILAGQDGASAPAAWSGQTSVSAGQVASVSAVGLAAQANYVLYGVVVSGDTPGVLVSAPAQRLALAAPSGPQLALLSGANGWVFAPIGPGPLDSGGWIAASGAPKSPPSLPPGYDFPYGLLDFVAIQGAQGSTLTASFALPAAMPANAVLWKYGRTAADATPHWYPLPVGVDGQPGSYSVSGDRQTLTLRITDGGLGDSDLKANSVIVDPVAIGVPLADTSGGQAGGGNAVAGGPVAVPTLSPGSLVALIGLLLLVAAWSRRLGSRPG